MAQNNLEMLETGIHDYLEWMKSNEYSQPSCMSYKKVLDNFFAFIKRKSITCNDIFTLDTIEGFIKDRGRTSISEAAVRGLCRYLFLQKRIQKPIQKQRYQLPEIYEDYLEYYERIRHVPPIKIVKIKRVLAAFYEYLQKCKIPLSSIKIEQIDAFQADFNKPFRPGTCETYRFYLRGFLSYLYHERKILPRDLAPFVRGPIMFARAKPPKFLRPHEVQRLFDSLELSCAKELRTYAMAHLAYYLGLRPKEITLISLDDICFVKGELSVNDRKNNRPLKLPLPENTIKAIAAYIIGGRPKTKHRRLFLTLKAPYGPITPAVVSHYIKNSMHKAALPSSAYWLRHTYAQNLLEAGASIYELKEMLGHETINSSRNYLHIHTKLMREVLFDETL
jgi:site-specific recombinase XerD